MRSHALRPLLLSAALLLAPRSALAADEGGAPAPAPEAPAPAQEAPPPGPVALKFSGWGDIQFAYFNYGENQNRPGGAQRDSRMAFDTTRLVMELKAQLPYGIQAEAEVEFEHGGTGSSLELEYEEFGEYGTEVGKGGEVLVEELNLSKKLGEHFTLAVGRFYVAVGTLNQYGRPTDYLATVRSEAETLLLPISWDEMGVQGRYQREGLRVTAQVINGMDSTGFSSQRWIAGGHQRRFELVRASDLAMVLRADITRFEGLSFGTSAYYGGTTRNRPKPDLVPSCDDAAATDTVVAPCGYVAAPLLLLDAHLALERGPWRAKALVLWGSLHNADDISARNARLSNLLSVARTPVAEQALGVWGEVGYDLAPLLHLGEAQRLEPFVRVDFADSMFNPRADLFDNPRFRRTIYTAGASYTLARHFFSKLDFSHRRLGGSSFRPESTLRVSTGFVY
ncbi:hypothetical protein P2318_22675 [Myxococcaceae bacterium GXIMD 01537]